MTALIDPLVASARIVAPEEAALNGSELVLMKISLRLARMAGVPLRVVQFPDGVAAMVVGDPNDTEAWLAMLAKVHAAAIAGQVGPVHVGGEDVP